MNVCIRWRYLLVWVMTRTVLFLCLSMLCNTAVRAHEMSLAELEMRELAKGEFIWSWGQSGKGSVPISADLTPRWPKGCVAREQSLRCAELGLVGHLAIDGVGKSYSAAMVRIHWRDGQTRVYTITAAQPQVYLYGAANDERGAKEVVTAYTVLGIEHILGGFDHLLFVCSLLFLVGFNRRLIWTISAFTLAHSLTLASSALGWLTLRSAPVEATIALSIVLVAAEAIRRRETLAQQWPALVSFIFGLVHGLGFAGALKEIGLPESHLPLALLTFNIGVEAGQLAMVALAYIVTRLLAGKTWYTQARQPALYAIGIVASYWSWTRIAAILP
ncbi:MAG: HupE/UreJ family protein [Pseudomonadota bacterium]